MAKPNFLIVGAPKSGTTALHNYLKQHPQVYLPKSALYYFCYDLTFPTSPLPESVYMDYYTDADSWKAVGDTSVYYLLSPGAAQKIKMFNPEARIIIMLRNPVEMVYSLHSEHFSMGNEPIEDFEEALNAEAARRRGELLPAYRRCPAEALFYSSVAKYYEQVLRYKSVFSDDKIHIVFYDDFKADTELEYRKVLKFLGLENSMPDSFKVINPNKRPRNMTFLSFLMTPPGFIKATGRFLFPHHTKRREWVIDRLWGINTKYTPRKPLTEALKQRLLDMYKEDIEKLGKLLNRDLSNWIKL